MLQLINQIKQDEGFRGMPYKDTEDRLTIGYGTLLPLTKQEAEWLLLHRLTGLIDELESKCEVYNKLPEEAKEIIKNMAYNLGVPKLCKFKKMWKALEEKNYNKAADEMLDSRWAKQVKSRAINLANQMRNI